MIEFETICALATPSGEGAIGVIRLSGEKAIEIADKIFYNPKGKHILIDAKSHTAHFGNIINKGKLIDECICTVFRSPHSYTGENSVEFSVHGSKYILQQTILALIENGAVPATEGEFTKRAFLNGKLDLSQAEAVADLIQSHNNAAHELAIKQLRGGYHDTLTELRSKLIDISSLLELELDFSEEDVEFADRTNLINTINQTKERVTELIESYSLGNCFKNGIPVSIIGKPNAGKSTLLNTFLNDERAIVSDIEGTTRDTIEEKVSLRGLEFRFIDTAGIRKSSNTIEAEGIKRTFKAVEDSKIVLLLIDITKTTPEQANEEIKKLKEEIDFKDKTLILVANKTDKAKTKDKEWDKIGAIQISASKKQNIGQIVERMLSIINPNDLTDKVFITNSRHYDSLTKVLESIEKIEKDFQNELPSDLIASDIRTALHHLGEITGEVTTEDILTNIFSKFCIGK
ncbi:MAG: tRNA uridine-5-carboxymethylaminomethyl(34) synthesis GTPase MnmE [Bacteroidales bacterium]|nr:tRNA uridine-5-carboxymethylaminomethyl(34) synthesis GTPase MnmE [Bacteroidales bacterium]